MAIIGGSGVAVRISELRDIVNVVCPTRTDGDILVWNDALQIWNCTAPTAGLTPHALTDHTNVDTTGQSAGDCLCLSGGVWVPTAPQAIVDAATIDLDDLGDVNAGSPVANDCLCWDGAEWVNTTPADIAANIALDDLSDVNVGTPGPAEDGYVLQWDDTLGEYNLVAQSGGGASALNDLSDVDTTGFGTDDCLCYDGANWVPTSPQDIVDNATINLDDLGDVNVGSPGAPEDGYLVRWNNSATEYDLVAPSSTAKQVITGVTASTTQSQGEEQQTFTSDDVIVRVTTVANDDDVITMDGALAGTVVLIHNEGANDLQVFPDTGDNFYGSATNASTTILPDESATFVGLDTTEWLAISEVSGSGALFLDDLTDVNVGSPGAAEDGYVLTWNDGTQEYDLQFPTSDSQFIGAITASTTQTQGQEQQTWDADKTEITVVVTTVANDGDVITLDDAAENIVVCVINDGAFDLQVFPATGGDLGEGLNTSTTIFTDESATFVGKSSTDWEPISEAKLGVVLLNELTDVSSATTPATENYLRFNGATWDDAPPTDLAAQITLDDISDVTAPSPSTNDLLEFDGANWVNTTPAAMAANIAFNDLSDVSEASPVAGDFVYYDGANYTAATRNISTLSDVDTTGVADTNFLQYVSGSGEWQPAALSDINLGDLGDVSLGSPSAGEVLRYSGAAWVDATLGSGDVTNASTVTGATVTDALNTIDSYGSDDIDNDSTVNGGAGNVSDALEALDTAITGLGSDDVTNDSTVTGATVSDALETLDAALPAYTTLGGYVPSGGTASGTGWSCTLMGGDIYEFTFTGGPTALADIGLVVQPINGSYPGITNVAVEIVYGGSAGRFDVQFTNDGVVYTLQDFMFTAIWE